MVEKFGFHVFGPGGGLLLATMSFKSEELARVYESKAVSAGYVPRAVPRNEHCRWVGCVGSGTCSCCGTLLPLASGKAA